MDKLVNINRSRVYEQIVQQVCDKKKYDESGKTLFPTIREFLSFCALLGFSQDKRLPLDKSQGVEDIAGAQYINNEAEEIVYLIACLAEKSFSIALEGMAKEEAKECHFRLGVTRFLMTKYEQALANFDIFLQENKDLQDPKFRQATLYKGNVRGRIGRYA